MYSTPITDLEKKKKIPRQAYRRVGAFGQAVCCFLAAMLHLMWLVLERVWPAEDIELAPEFPSTCLGFESDASSKVK